MTQGYRFGGGAYCWVGDFIQYPVQDVKRP